VLTPWHLAHIGGIATRAPGLVCVEATAVQEVGRITPNDSGLWKDPQIKSHADVVEFVHGQGHHIMLQLAHAGRKANTAAPWIKAGEKLPEQVCKYFKSHKTPRKSGGG
jgi:2,4-dienoyl-CoA reductase-like NADH-dependent reductase (Old Yellow Enzyme family)